MKKLTLLLMLVALGAFVVGCAPSSTPAPPADSAPETTDDGAAEGDADAGDADAGDADAGDADAGDADAGDADADADGDGAAEGGDGA